MFRILGFSAPRRALWCFLVLKPVKVCPKASVIWEHLGQVIVYLPVFEIHPIISLRNEAMCLSPLIRCIPFLLPSLEAILSHILLVLLLFLWGTLRCSYSCFLSTASTSMGIIPAITHTATSETGQKAQDTLRALSQLIAAIFRRHSLILRALPQMAIPYVSMEITTLTLGVYSEVAEINRCLAWASLMLWPL